MAWKPAAVQPGTSRGVSARRSVRRSGRAPWIVAVSFVVLTASPITALIWASVSLSTTAVSREAQEKAATAAAASSAFLDERFRTWTQTLDSFAELYLSPDIDSPTALNKDLNLMLQSHLNVDIAFVETTDGQPITGQPESVTDQPWRPYAVPSSDRSVYREDWLQAMGDAASKPVLTPVAARDSNDNSGIAAAIALHQDGFMTAQRVGYLIAITDLVDLQSLVDGYRQSSNASMTVIDGSGNPIVWPGSQSGVAPPSQLGSTSAVREALAGHPTVVTRAGSNGAQSFNAYAAIPNPGWVVVVDIPAGESTADVGELRTTVLTIGLVLGLILLAMLGGALAMLRRTELAAALRKRVGSLARLNEAARSVHEQRGTAALEMIAETSRGLVAADFSVLSLDGGTPADKRSLTRGGDESVDPASLMALAAAITARVEARAVVEMESTRELWAADEAPDAPSIGPVVSVPLAAGDQVLGRLTVARMAGKSPFGIEEVALLEQMAGHAVTAFEKARHEEDLSENLETERERFRTAFEGMPVGMAVLDTDLRPVRVNQALADMFGWRFSDLARLSPLDRGFPTIEAWDVSSDASELLQGARAAVQGEHRALTSDGHWLWILITMSVVRDRRGSPVWFLIQFQDITERRHALDMRLEGVIRESEQKTRFLAMMSHELRTPLNAIMGFAQLLARPAFGHLSDRQRRYVDNIAESGEHLLALINDILDFTRIRSGELKVEMQTVEILPLVQDLVSKSRPDLDAKGLTIEAEVEPGVEAWADRLRLSQVLWNLISNASKFTPSGGLISISAVAVAGKVCIDVADTGVGIPAEEQQRIFNEFTQLDSSMSRQQQGTGLGLSISKHLTELMGGTISVASRMGQGTTFTITLREHASLTLVAPERAS